MKPNRKYLIVLTLLVLFLVVAVSAANAGQDPLLSKSGYGFSDVSQGRLS